MYTISTYLELPIAISNKWKEGEYPTLFGHNYNITINLYSNKLDENRMVVDFKKMKKILHTYFDQYDHSMILTPDNPLVEVYKKNFKENDIDFERSRLFVWDENPTAEYMSKYWHDEVLKLFEKEGLKIEKVAVKVEETSHNSVTYEEDIK